MSQRYDIAALAALADALADAASIHRSAAVVADDAELRRKLAARADKLAQICEEVRVDEQAEPGTLLKHIDRLKLATDSWFGDDDEAASTASREAKVTLLALIDDYLAGAEISPGLVDLLRDIRQRISGGKVIADERLGLGDLPG